MVVQGELPTEEVPPPATGASSWEEAIDGMIDDEFNENDDFDMNEDTEAAEDAIADVFGGGPLPNNDAVPENILQPAPTGESSPLIILESLESGHSHSVSEQGNGIPQDNSACFDVVSSGSSKGSQGSYADQVPSLSQSGSAGADAAETALEATRSDLGSPWTLPSDDNSSSSNGGGKGEESPKAEAPPALTDTPPVAADMDFFAEPAPVLVSSPPSEVETIEDVSNETAEIEDGIENLESQDDTDGVAEAKDIAKDSDESKAVQIDAIEPKAETIEPEKETIDPEKETVEPENETIDPEKETVEPAKKAVEPEQESNETIDPEKETEAPDKETEAPQEEPKMKAPKLCEEAEEPENEAERIQEETKEPVEDDIRVPESPMGSTAPFDEEPIKPGKPNANLTIKTSFSTEIPGRKDSLQEALEENDTNDDLTEGPSLMSDDVSDMVHRFAGVQTDESEDLDDILGGKGEPVSAPRNPVDGNLLSPKSDQAGVYSLRSTRTEEPAAASLRSTRTAEPAALLADPALLAASQKEVEALTSIQETAPVPSQSTEPSLAELQQQKTNPKPRATANPLDRIVASLESYEALQTRPPHVPLGTPQQRSFLGPARSGANTTFDSPASFQTRASGTPGSALSKESDQGGTSFWSNSAGETETQGGTSIGESFSRTGTSLASPAGTSMASPTNTVSPTGTSVAGSEVSRATYASDASQTDDSCLDQTLATSASHSVAQQTFSTAATDTFHTRGTYESNTPMSRGDSLSARTSISQSATEETETDRTRTDLSGVHTATSAESEASEESRGGRLWELANKEAEQRVATPLSPESSRFAESLMARTRSRADPDALVNGSASIDRDPDRPNMVKIGEQDGENFIVHTALARKRVRVVQLLIIGLLALLVSFLGNLWIQSSCHFVSAAVEVGENGQVFNLHYGLWKYSPIDSAFQGYAYCFQYDDEYTGDAPLFSRWFSCLALLGGSFSLAVLWIYLIFGRGNTCTWDLAVYTAGMSGCLQIATLIILAGPVCQRDECSLGPAGILSIIASVVYFILAFEMYYNTPMASWVTDLSACPSSERPGNLMANLEMTDFKHGAKAYVSRIVAGEKEPSLNQIQRGNKHPIGADMLERGYSPPAVIV